jgi:hypothetical protein
MTFVLLTTFKQKKRPSSEPIANKRDEDDDAGLLVVSLDNESDESNSRVKTTAIEVTNDDDCNYQNQFFWPENRE